MYAAYGVATPFLPAFVAARGIAPGELGLVLGAGTTVCLITAPLAARIGDLYDALRTVLVLCIALAAFVTLGYLSAEGFWLFLAVSVTQAAMLAPLGVLADALTLGAARRQGFEYGWVRGTGSAAFILGILLSGQAVAAQGLGIIVLLQASLLALAAVAARRLPAGRYEPRAAASLGGVGVLLRMPTFRKLVLIAALVLGSHAMQDAFAVIRWSAAGVSPAMVSVLWSEAVGAEVLVFFLIGPPLIRRLTPPGAMALAACAGILRWSVIGSTAEVWALALVQPLHGFTFALLHLACMRLLARLVPHGLEGTAQAIYATIGVGGASALLMLASGALYGRLGAHAFFVMAALCALALPLAWRLFGRD